jgi:hypothetical protein
MTCDEWYCADMDPSNPNAERSRAPAERVREQVEYLQLVAYARAEPQAFLNLVWREILTSEMRGPVRQAAGEAFSNWEIGWPNWRAEQPATGQTRGRNRWD